MNKHLILILLPLIAACSTLNEEECRFADWYTIGYKDGTRGRMPDYIHRHSKACRSFAVSVDHRQWEEGRQQGLKHYCTNEHA